MVTKTQIISLAFTKLGRGPVSDIDPFSAPKEVIAAALEYDILVVDSLASHPWRFAMLTKDLNLLADDPPFDDFSNAFILPVDYINILRTRPITNYRIFENLIYTNEESLQIDYTAKLDESKFPSWFTLYMVYHLASNIAMMITQNVQIAQLWGQAAEKQLLLARYKDSQQQPSFVIQNDQILASHFGNNILGNI